MDILQSVIGVRNNSVFPSPEPALYVNDLPGITLENISALATTEDKEGWKDVWRKVQQTANKKFDILLRAEFNRCCKLTGDVVKCLVEDEANAELFYLPLWYLYGVEIMIMRTSTDAMNRYTTIELEKAERLKGEYYTEFQTTLHDAVSGISRDNDCIKDCAPDNGPVRFRMQLP